MRPIVSYDDIVPQTLAQESPYTPADVSELPPKKRRKNGHNRQRQRAQYNNSYNGEHREPLSRASNKSQRDYGLKRESRKLTHEEVWDDSALIRAWDAAVEEYEVLNGPEKEWKKEPVTKSAIWFNIPPEEESSASTSPGPSFLTPSIPAVFAPDIEQEQAQDESSDPDNSRPINFDTFVPHHDPSLSHVRGIPNDKTSIHQSVVPPPAAPVTQAEAYNHAMGAWYWAGYWTGVYHTMSRPQVTQVDGEDNILHEGEEVAMDLEDDDEDEDVHDGSPTSADVDGDNPIPA